MGDAEVKRLHPLCMGSEFHAGGCTNESLLRTISMHVTNLLLFVLYGKWRKQTQLNATGITPSNTATTYIAPTMS